MKTTSFFKAYYTFLLSLLAFLKRIIFFSLFFSKDLKFEILVGSEGNLFMAKTQGGKASNPLLNLYIFLLDFLQVSKRSEHVYTFVSSHTRAQIYLLNCLEKMTRCFFSFPM